MYLGHSWIVLNINKLPDKKVIVSTNPDSSSPRFSLSMPVRFGNTREANINNEKLEIVNCCSCGEIDFLGLCCNCGPDIHSP